MLTEQAPGRVALRGEYQMAERNMAQLRRWSFALGSSLAAMAAASASPAAAQCAPDPTIAWGATDCTGTDADGLVVATSGTRVTIARDAIVRAGALGNAPGAITVTSMNAVVTVNGSIEGVADGSADTAGIAFYAGPRSTAPCDPYAGAGVGYCPPGSIQQFDPSVSANLSVAEGGAVTGAQAVLISQHPANETGTHYIGIGNAGTLTGTAGPAVVNLARGGSLSIANEATGRIDGIAGRIDYVRNAGLVDGAIGSAVAITATNYGYADIDNRGRILSTGTAPTLSSTGGGRLTVDNATGAVIGNDGGGGGAIYADGALTLNNSGTVRGSVVSSAGAGQNSVIDTRLGTIDGDVLLGGGDDTVRATFDFDSGRVSSVTGRLDGGAGTDTLAIGIDRDTTIAANPLPANFERFGLDLSDNAAVTLAPTFTAPSGLSVGGVGSLVNHADLVTSGAAVTGSSYSVSFTNAANITASLSGDGMASTGMAVVSGVGTLVNSGTITASGGAGAQVGRLDNGGTITASGTAAQVNNGAFTNSGTIVSTGGTGVVLTAWYASSTNTGTIRGATTGVALTGTLTNNGTIGGGIWGVVAEGSTTLFNEAGAMVEGGISKTDSSSIISNAGTIKGSVNLAVSAFHDYVPDVFVDAGGTVEGAILLGGGDDELIVDLATDSARMLAGATGGVDGGAGYDTLRYRVNADVEMQLAPVAGFEGLAYEVAGGAALTLRSPDMLATTLGLTGNGTVTLEGVISAADRTLIDTAIRTTDELLSGTSGTARDLTIINNAALTLTSAALDPYARRFAINASQADVVNNGYITVANPAEPDSPWYAAHSAAIYYAGALTNTGTILVSGGGSAIDYAESLVNSGTISGTGQSTGYTALSGISSVGTLDNSGTIRFDGDAVAMGQGFSVVPAITNTGTIESLNGTAVRLGQNAVLTNGAAGTIRGNVAIDLASGGTIVNRGTIAGDVAANYYAWGSTAFVDDGGAVEGDVRFGDGSDVFIMTDAQSGVTGIIDGGEGVNTWGHALRESGSVSVVPSGQFVNFQNAAVLALGTETVVSIADDIGGAPFTGTVLLGGSGRIVNTATIAGRLGDAYWYSLARALPEIASGLAAFENRGTLTGGFSAMVADFANAGSISSASAAESDFPDAGVQIYSRDEVTFANTGQIANGVELAASGMTVTNGGAITGGNEYGAAALDMVLNAPDFDVDDRDRVLTASLVNSGTITGTGTAVRAYANPYYYPYNPYHLTWPSVASVVITNTVTGVISGGGIAIDVGSGALTLDNAGTVSVLPSDSDSADRASRPALAYAVVTSGDVAATIRNIGTLDGALWLGGGDDLVENAGSITRPVFLGAGNDTFIQHANAVLGGTVDGGEGIDRFVVLANGDSALDAGQIVRFEQLAQTGTGTVRYSGSFEADTIELQGGTLAVEAGRTLATAGPVTVTGGISGVNVLNRGTIAGALVLGAGNDSFSEHAGSLARGGVDGGAGVDLYRVVLAGDRTGIGARTGFEQLSVEGTGTLTLALDQDFQSVALAGTNLTAVFGGFTIGRVDGSHAAEQVVLDGDAALVALGAGNDALSLGSATLAGRYDGGTGSNALRFAAQGPVTLTGTATGFETLSLAGGELNVAGTLGSAGASLAFVDGTQSLVIAASGTLAGTVNLGAGDDSFRLAAGGMLAGTIDGGAGIDTATLETGASGFKLSAGQIAGFENLRGEGAGTLTLADGAFAFDSMTTGGGLAIGRNATLAAGRVALGGAGGTLAIAGQFAGSIAGGAGTDVIEVSGNAAFAAISDVEALRMSAGLATVSGRASLGAITLNGGRLVGLAGSTITAPTIEVAQGAVFGSAGTVNAAVTVVGTLSPGASPGTMTVNGDVALAGTSVSVFEITPTFSDSLLVNGNLAIAQGATLQILADQAVTPGRSLDLITATGGITGSFSTIIKPASLFGFVVQRAGTISLLGQFLNDPAYSGQVRSTIDYVNTVLVSGAATDAFLTAVPALVSGAGVTDQAAFAQLSPEAYASAGQIAVEHGLELAATGRSDTFAAPADLAGNMPRAFTFASALGSTRTLERGADGTTQAHTNGYGFLGGLGWGGSQWSIGGFVGYLESRQTLAGRGASTEVDGIVAGIHGRWNADSGMGVKATIGYSGGKASTRRALPGGSNLTASGDYDLTGWTGDISVDYAVPLGRDWTVRPGIGVTAIRTTRDGVGEAGGGAFALDVVRERDHAVFVDGAITFQGGQRQGAALRPYLSIGMRYQVDGRTPYALAALGGGSYGLQSAGAARAPLLATATVGTDLALSSRLSLFGALSGASGDTDNQAGARTGLRLAF